MQARTHAQNKYMHTSKEVLSKIECKMAREDSEKGAHSVDRLIQEETTLGKCCVNSMGKLDQAQGAQANFRCIHQGVSRR